MAVNRQNFWGVRPISAPSVISTWKNLCTNRVKNTEISREDIGKFMKTYVEENNMSQPRCSLIWSMVGKKILLATPLLKWYLEHGLEVRFKYYKLVKSQENFF
jgi:hypothetical protein